MPLTEEAVVQYVSQTSQPTTRELATHFGVPLAKMRAFLLGMDQKQYGQGTLTHGDMGTEHVGVQGRKRQAPSGSSRRARF